MARTETYFDENDDRVDADDGVDEPTGLYLVEGKPRTQAAATKILRRALAEAIADADADGLWDVFRAHAMRHEYSIFVDSLIADHRAELSAAIFNEDRAELSQKAVESLRVEAVRVEVTKKLESELMPAIRAQVTARLEGLMEPALRQQVASRLRTELRAEIEEALRAELMQDPEFVGAAKRDLQRKLLGL